MNEIKFTNKIRQALNEGSRLNGDTGAHIAERLRAAREQALARRKLERSPALAWARSAAANACVAREQCVFTLPSEQPMAFAVSATSSSSQ